ncbi:hypothetical protein M569_12544 [Genlisea aurea]|uniref:Uncharacterized protein n=1 Tax=Genlisea aurea TaxID=192259 RepID=S8DR07_9LAMI|nr:hypothetical protein M569_12544 [Genlisea aurea]
MADEQLLVNGEFSEDRSVEITGDDDDASLKISELTQKIIDLERENREVSEETERYRQQVGKLRDALEELNTDNGELRGKLLKAESDNRSLQAVAAHAAALETEVSRLHHDLASAESDLHELEGLLKEMEVAKEREHEKDAKLEALEKEREILSSQVRHLEAVRNSLKDEKDSQEKEILGLKKSIEELQGAIETSKSLEKLKTELENTIDNMKGEISILENNLIEKEELINGFEVKQRSVGNGGDPSGFVESEKNGFIGNPGFQKHLIIVGGSTVAAVAVMGIACYLHAARKH